MKIFGYDISVRKAPAEQTEQLVKRSYDAAATTRHNKTHWAFADGRDANSIIFQDLPTLRNRCRYECRNNGYAEGIIDTIANDIVGTGPTPQLDSENKNINEIEDKFNDWLEDCDIEGGCLADLLQIAGGWSQCESGEGLIAFKNLKGASPKEVSLRLLAIEPDRLYTPYSLVGNSLLDNTIRDGIKFDEDGRPSIYYISKYHPGAMWTTGVDDFVQVPASQIIHLYRKKRAGQSRGVPWISSSLPLFAALRRFTLATLDSAETAANQSGILTTETDVDDTDATYMAGEEVEIPRNSFLTVSKDSDLKQMKSEHPATTYEMFKNQIINEIARPVNMPFNVAAGNSSDYNYASGRLDWQTYFRFISVIRKWEERKALNKIFWLWYREASLIPRFFKYASNDLIKVTWHWPGSKHVDPIKEANAQRIRLGSLTTTLQDEYAEQGMDWERKLTQIKKEKDKMRELGLEMEDISKPANDPQNQDEPDKKNKERK